MRYILIVFIGCFIFVSCSENSPTKDAKVVEPEVEEAIEEILLEEEISIPKEDTYEDNTKTLSAIHKHWEIQTEELINESGTLIWASDDTGLPYYHNFRIVNAEGDTIDFVFEGGEYSSEFIGYEGMECEVKFSEKTTHYQVEIAEWVNDEYLVNEQPYLHEDYKDFYVYEGIFYAEDLSGGLPSDYYVYSGIDTLFLSGFIYEEDIERSGKSVMIYYGLNERNIAALVTFPALNKN